MPFASRRQQRWAFANKKPFAKRWAKETPSFAALPERKDAGTPLHGPGGLLSAPGVGGRLRKRLKAALGVTTKPMTRSEAASVAAHARWDKTPRKVKPPTKGRTPAKTEQERADARQSQQRERDEARDAQRAQNRADVLRSLNIAPDGAAALAALRDGQQPDADAIARGGFVDAGLVEQAADGSYRMTPAGRAVLSAADAGDRGRAGDTISGGRDRVLTRRQRQQSAEARKKQPKPEQGGGGKEKPKPIDVSKRMRRINTRLARMRRRRGIRTKAQTAEDRAMFAKMGGGGKGGGGGSAGGGALWSKGPDGKRTPTDKQRDSQQQRQIRQLVVSDKKRDAHARQAGDKAETETRKRYRVEPRGSGEYSLSDQNRSTSAYRGVSVASGDKDKVERALMTKIRTARTRAENDARQEVNFYNSDVRGGMYSTPSSAKRDRDKFKSFTVYKSANGTPRWLARTTTAYRDRDREIIAIKALDADSQRMTAAGQFGPLRMWHLGRPDPFDPATPWGPGVDVGDCDFSMQVGRTRVESGTFKSAALARRIAATAAEYELSPGFFHPPDQPGADGVFTTIRTFERSLVPIKYGRASNLFTGLTVKEQRMDPQEENRRLKAVISQLGLDQQAAAALTSGLIQADKSAQQQGIAYKSDDGAQTVVINGVTYTAQAPAYEAPPDVVINGVTYKAAPPPFLADDEAEKADFAEGEAAGEEMADMGMDDAQLVAAIADAVVAKIAPLFGDMKMSELKAMLSGVATKDDSRAQEIAALKTAHAQLTQRLADLTGDQPAVILPDDVAAALKSAGPQAPPDPNAPQIPNDPARPFAAVAAQTFPQLYQPTPQGGWNGWAPQQPLPPAQS